MYSALCKIKPASVASVQHIANFSISLRRAIHKKRDYPFRSDGGTKGPFTVEDWADWDIYNYAHDRENFRVEWRTVPNPAPTAASTKELITITTDPTDIQHLNGVDESFKETRVARIFESTKSAMQSGTNNGRQWRIEFDTQERWENPLMGWTSSGDPLSNLSICFLNEEEAVRYCERNGWDWYIQPSSFKRSVKPKSYGENFSWNKRTRVSTK